MPAFLRSPWTIWAISGLSCVLVDTSPATLVVFPASPACARSSRALAGLNANSSSSFGS